MLLRFFAFLALELLGAVLGRMVIQEPRLGLGTSLGLVVAGLLWVMLDSWRGLRVSRWLREEELPEAPIRRGLWGVTAERARRAVRMRDRALRDSDRRLQDFLQALQASPNGIVLLDADGHIEWLNQTAAHHFGLDPVRDQMQMLVNLVREPSFTSYVASGDYNSSVTITARDHTTTHPVRLSVQLHHYGEGRRLLLSRDITMYEQAEAMRRDFVANVSHEIRTPLTVLSGFVETLQTLALDGSERARYLDLMAQQSARMQSLVNDLLMLSRLEGSPLPGEGEWISIPVLMGHLQQEAHALSSMLSARSGGVEHCIQFDAAPAMELSGVPSELHSAMSNLVGNAVRYTPAGGLVRCSWTLHGDGRAEFWVQDSGPGIAPEHLPRITERFYRVDRSRSRDTGGTGLGLAIVKHVAQRHGIELRIESVIGKGSRFGLQIPASRLRPYTEGQPAALAA